MSNRNKKLAEKFFEQRRLDRARAELEANRARRKAKIKSAVNKLFGREREE